MKSGIKEEAKNYIKEMGEITLSAFKEKMRIDKSDAKELLWELVTDGFVEHSVGFLFRCVGTDGKNTSRDEEDKSKDGSRRSVYEALFGINKEAKVEDSEKDDLYYQRDRLEQRRRELIRRMEAELNDDDDDDDDDEWLFGDDDDDDDDDAEKTIDEIQRETLKKISATEEPSEDAEDEESDEDETALREPKEITLVDIERRRALAKMATSFGCTGQFIREGKEYFCKLGITYPDDTEMQFKLSYPNKITLSDSGGTYTFISKYFNMSDDNVLKRIKNVMDDYGLRLRVENNKSELYIQIRDENSAFMSFLWLFSAIERITSIQSEGLLSVVSDEFDSFCKSELVRIAIEEKASFLEAKECAQSLYIQSLEDDDALKKNAYKNIVETLEGITEEGYESFKREILGEEEE